MRVVFMGTPEFAGDILKTLIEHVDVVGVYTRPDAVRGRGKKAVASPVKEVACAAGLPVFTPRTLRDADSVEELRALHPDAICVAAYGAILPKEVLEIPRIGCFNVHASLLPRWRGAAPIERAILSGDETVGVCIMAMEEGLDTGDYCLCAETDTGEKSAEELTSELASLGGTLLVEALKGAGRGTLTWTPQDSDAATYANKVEKHELNLSPAATARENLLRVRASSQAHPARAVIAGRRGTVVGAKLPADAGSSEALPGQGECALVAKHLYLGCSDGALEVCSFKPDGKSAMDGAAFAAGNPSVRSGEASWEAADA